MTRDMTNTVSRLAAVVILAAIGAHRMAIGHRPKGIEAYHASVRESAKDVPRQIGPWIASDVPVPAQAIKVLDPNVILSRRYLNVENGVSAGFLFVHCSDAHEMAGHFPLRCYPAQGWEVRSSTPADWTVAGLEVAGMEYEFHRTSADRSRDESLVVANCLFRPDGRILRDIGAMTRSLLNAGDQSSGAAQIQVYFDAEVPPERRRDAVVALMSGYRPLIDSVLSAPTPAQPGSDSGPTASKTK